MSEKITKARRAKITNPLRHGLRSRHLGELEGYDPDLRDGYQKDLKRNIKRMRLILKRADSYAKSITEMGQEHLAFLKEYTRAIGVLDRLQRQSLELTRVEDDELDLSERGKGLPERIRELKERQKRSGGRLG